jgi:hypothetical protein
VFSAPLPVKAGRYFPGGIEISRAIIVSIFSEQLFKQHGKLQYFVPKAANVTHFNGFIDLTNRSHHCVPLKKLAIDVE